MEPIEIIILAAGVILVAATYILSEKFEVGGKEIEGELSNNTRRIAEELVREEVERELAEAVDEKVEAALVEMDRIANEKIMAVGNYSEEILDRINKNHNEVMFLYNMLNEKESTLKETIMDIEALKQSIKKMAVVGNMSAAMAKQPEKSADKTAYEPEPSSEAEKGDETIQEKAAPEKATLRKRKAEQPPNGEGNKNEEILRLHASGISNMEIAKRLGIGIGEVRLVIDLFRKDG